MNTKLNHWSNYWKAGNLTSLPQDFLENYDGEIGSFWKDSFSSLQDNSNILDLCTGNGAIALLASKYSADHNKEFKVIGVDAAEIDKQSIALKYTHLTRLLNNIDFISNCEIENIDLAPSEFDLITSQYGVEYCDWSASAKQISRLLRVNGRFNFISHSYDTDILKFMEQEQEDYASLQEFGFFTVFSNYFKGKSSYKETVKKLDKIQKKIMDLHKSRGSDLFAGILEFLQQIVRMDKSTFRQFDSKIKSLYLQHTFAFARLKDVVGVSNQIKKQPDWYLAFVNEGLELKEKGDILQAGCHNAGRYYKFVKLK